MSAKKEDVSRFLNSQCVATGNAEDTITAQALFFRYLRWATNTSAEPLGRLGFDRVVATYFKRHKSRTGPLRNHWAWVGIAFAPCASGSNANSTATNEGSAP